MSNDEQAEYTEEGATRLLEHREIKKFSKQTIPTDTFQDLCMSIEIIEKEITALHARTGIKVAMFAVHGKIGVAHNYNQLLLWLKSELVTLITQKLNKCIRYQVHMFYKGFNEHITSKYGVVCHTYGLSPSSRA
ncbi:hypothetical protein FIBSPDRAFT_946504 [Athelia psychrophila]|uniref:Uncharacterized protein n=1 Tax=Athelia psychrophila TaxID=1759441 RepID=A0A166SZ84_9AGAM|nr:hypothetical protein FIBSPDRAFT_946504 [Fibularhizoctonia sp. CBS 109695]